MSLTQNIPQYHSCHSVRTKKGSKLALCLISKISIHPICMLVNSIMVLHPSEICFLYGFYMVGLAGLFSRWASPRRLLLGGWGDSALHYQVYIVSLFVWFLFSLFVFHMFAYSVRLKILQFSLIIIEHSHHQE